MQQHRRGEPGEQQQEQQQLHLQRMHVEYEHRKLELPAVPGKKLLKRYWML